MKVKALKKQEAARRGAKRNLALSLSSCGNANISIGVDSDKEIYCDTCPVNEEFVLTFEYYMTEVSVEYDFAY